MIAHAAEPTTTAEVEQRFRRDLGSSQTEWSR